MKNEEYYKNLKKCPSYKHRKYYEKRLKEKADQIYEEKTKDLTGDSFLEALEELEDMHLDALVGKIHYNLPEAHAIVKLLSKIKHYDKEKTYPLSWTSAWDDESRDNGKVIYNEMKVPEMISRLECISSEKFGSNIEEWNRWLDAWELYPVPSGNR